MSKTADMPVCEECGYGLAGLQEAPPGTVRCPECGVESELARAPRLRPWPSRWRLARQLCGLFATNVVVLLLLIWLVATVGVARLPRQPMAIIVVTLMGCLPLTGLVQPGLSAMLLAEQHAIRPRRTAVFLRVYGAATAVNGLIFLVGLIIADQLDAW